jgi:hypothetical protein
LILRGREKALQQLCDAFIAQAQLLPDSDDLEKDSGLGFIRYNPESLHR